MSCFDCSAPCNTYHILTGPVVCCVQKSLVVGGPEATLKYLGYNIYIYILVITCTTVVGGGGGGGAFCPEMGRGEHCNASIG